jgi:hypothetical protein
MQHTWEHARELGLKEGLETGREEGQVLQARAALRHLLARRALATSAADEAKIDRCTDLRTLNHWLDQALTAETAAEALRGGRATRRRKTRSS